MFININDFFFVEQAITPSINGMIFLGGVGPDGQAGFILSGLDASGIDRSVMWFNSPSGSKADIDSLGGITNGEFLAADFNSDGACDLSVSGKSKDTGIANIIIDSSGKHVDLPLDGLMSQAFGDLDRDGDLDLIQLIDRGTEVGLAIYMNNADGNRPPAVQDDLALLIYDRVFLYCYARPDDHTPAGAITYDLDIFKDGGEHLPGGFDRVNGWRLSASHGNRGTSNYALVRRLAPATFAYSFQIIDNAFHAGPDESIFEGGGPSGSNGVCGEITTQLIETCGEERIFLEAPMPALWISFRDGLISESDKLSFVPEVSDTIFYFVPELACDGLNAFVIQYTDELIKETTDSLFVCQDQTLTLEVEEGWDEITWSSSRRGHLSDQPVIQFLVTEEDTVSVLLVEEDRCRIRRNTVLKLSLPVVEIETPTVQIEKGQSIVLSAFGDGTFQWTPSKGLDNDTISHPTASPERTTYYTVTLTDSIGCTTSGTVHVIVETTAFVPTLFTPNGDGSNDKLLVYGLDQVQRFHFSIHDRAGRVVYETSDALEAVTQGWDGTFKGTQQPGGVYYWKVEGVLNDGLPVLLNGKTSGSIVLVR